MVRLRHYTPRDSAQYLGGASRTRTPARAAREDRRGLPSAATTHGEAGRMTARHKRMMLIGAVLGGVIVSAALALRALEQNLLYFFSPTQVMAGEVPTERTFRLGGM